MKTVNLFVVCLLVCTEGAVNSVLRVPNFVSVTPVGWIKTVQAEGRCPIFVRDISCQGEFPPRDCMAKGLTRRNVPCEM